MILRGTAEIVIEGRRLARFGPGAVVGADSTTDVAAVPGQVKAATPMTVLVLGPADATAAG